MYWKRWQLIFIYESTCAPRIGDRKCGWSRIRLPVFDTQRLRRDEKWSVLSALTMGGYLEDLLIVEGSVTMELIGEWFEHKLLPQLRPGQISVIDDASIHRS
jgi:hypothetical protein